MNKFPLVIYYCLDCGADMVVRQYSVRRYCPACVARRERLSPGRPRGNAPRELPESKLVFKGNNVADARAHLPAIMAAKDKLLDSQSVGELVINKELHND